MLCRKSLLGQSEGGSIPNREFAFSHPDYLTDLVRYTFGKSATLSFGIVRPPVAVRYHLFTKPRIIVALAQLFVICFECRVTNNRDFEAPTLGTK